MKILISIMMVLLSLTGFAYTDCMGPKDVSFWAKIPTQSLAVVSCYAFALFLLCLPIRYFQKKKKIKWPILELYLIFLYGIWFWTDAQFHWTDQLFKSWTFDLSFSLFLVYFYLIYRERLIPFFTKMTKSHLMIFSIPAIFAIAFYKFFLGDGNVECGSEYMQGYPLSHFLAIFFWATFAWLIFSRSWKVFVASLPFTYLFFYVGRLLIPFLLYTFYKFSSSYDPTWFVIRDLSSDLVLSGEVIYIVVFAFIFILQVFVHFVQCRVERSKTKL